MDGKKAPYAHATGCSCQASQAPEPCTVNRPKPNPDPSGNGNRLTRSPTQWTVDGLRPNPTAAAGSGYVSITSFMARNLGVVFPALPR